MLKSNSYASDHLIPQLAGIENTASFVGESAIERYSPMRVAFMNNSSCLHITITETRPIALFRRAQATMISGSKVRKFDRPNPWRRVEY